MPQGSTIRKCDLFGGNETPYLVAHSTNLFRGQIEELLEGYCEKNCVNVSSIAYEEGSSEIKASLRPEEASGQTETSLRDFVNQSIAAFLISKNPGSIFASTVTAIQVVEDIESGPNIKHSAEIKILKQKTYEHLMLVVAEANVFRGDDKKPSAVMTIKGVINKKS